MLGTILTLALGVSPLAGAAPACGVGWRGAQIVESANYLIAYRTQPPKIAVGHHFSVEFTACRKSNPADPLDIAVDAYMPEHGHGMNYRAVVKPAGKAASPAAATQFRADGLMFHMPGRWDLYFDVRSASGAERLTRSLVLE